MSIVIKNMKMPKCCYECKLRIDCKAIDYSASVVDFTIKQDNCELIKNELTFGSGGVAITPCILDGMACLMLNTQEEHSLGEKVDTEKEWYQNPFIRLNFANEKSIDVLINNLNRLKRFMNGEFDEENIAEVDI